MLLLPANVGGIYVHRARVVYIFQILINESLIRGPHDPDTLCLVAGHAFHYSRQSVFHLLCIHQSHLITNIIYIGIYVAGYIDYGFQRYVSWGVNCMYV